LLEKIREIRERALDADHPDTAATFLSIAKVYNNQGKYDEALSWYRKSYRILRKLGDTHPRTMTVEDNMEDCYSKSGRSEPFEQWLQGEIDK
jgi:tetratricopeptide (TPR) repeat protein